MSDKRGLRAVARARRGAFFATGPQPVRPDPRLLARLSPGTVMASYAPIGSEADPRLLEAAALDLGCRLALPLVVDREAPLRFLAWPAGEPLAAGPFGLANPQADWDEIAPDIVLTPLLAFDAALNRLGQGAGHYDRAFVRHPGAWRLGVAWSVQRVAALPADPWDVPLHAIITETDWWTP